MSREELLVSLAQLIQPSPNNKLNKQTSKPGNEIPVSYKPEFEIFQGNQARIKASIPLSPASLMEESQSIISAIKSSINGHDRATASAIQTLSAVVKNSSTEEGFLIIASVLTEDLVLSLGSCRKYSVRARILDLLVGIVRKWKGEIRVLREEFVIRVFVGFTSDIYPILRRNGLEGLCEVLAVAGNGVAICVVMKWYERFVGLLKDDCELVRTSAIKLVGLCGEIIARSENEEDKIERINSIFIQVCSMCRDLSKKVRIESFKALGKMNLVSESILTQSLSKKLLKPKTGDKKSIIKSEQEMEFNHVFLCGAGAFIHGIEDEFYEVRIEACKSLGKLALLNIKFSEGALNSLMDLINDDYELIRLESLNHLYNMAIHGFLNFQEKHSEMFEGLLMDFSGEVRNGARKIIGLIKYPKFEKFKSIFNELITNLEKYPNEEEDIFLTLFSLGKNHTKFSLKLAKDLTNNQSNKEELNLDKPGVSCTIVLSISSPFYNKQIASDFPLILFIYAIPLFNRISKSLKSIINSDSLLSFLLERNDLKMEWNDLIVKNENSKGLNDEFKEFIEMILKNVSEIWPLMKYRKEFNIQRIIRGCIEELEMLDLDEDISTCEIIELILQYVKIIHIFSEIWYAINSTIYTSFSMKNLCNLLEKLDYSLRRIKFGFIGLNNELEFQIMDFSLLSDLIKLSMVGINSDQILRNINLKISNSDQISEFFKEIKKLIEGNSLHDFKLYDLLEFFNIQELKFDFEVNSIKAKLKAIGNNSENPIPFISGLPVGINFHISVYNTSINNKLWIKMEINGVFTEFVYLNLDQFEGCDKLREYRKVVPLYKTPKADSFEIRVCVVMECLSEENKLSEERERGPNYEFIELCDECIVYFVNMENR